MASGNSQQGAPQFSADGRWWWDGAAWVPAEQARGLAEAFGSGPPPPPFDAAEIRKILLWDPWGRLRLLWAVILGKSTTRGWSGDRRGLTTTSRRQVWRYFALTLALPLLLVLLSWLWSLLDG